MILRNKSDRAGQQNVHGLGINRKIIYMVFEFHGYAWIECNDSMVITEGVSNTLFDHRTRHRGERTRLRWVVQKCLIMLVVHNIILSWRDGCRQRQYRRAEVVAAKELKMVYIKPIKKKKKIGKLYSTYH